MELPKDPIMLLSFINMKLRDEFSSLDELAASYGLDKNELAAKMEKINYFYEKETNQFK